ncbi:MAG TPA: VOC family protein [Thermoleophilaceae bacterium]|nr:VOC family protein [Thermoleophilaceae bacterium]
MTPVRRLDHVAIAVRDSARAAADFEKRLGIRAVHSEELSQPPVRLTYLDAGNCFIQLVEPLSPDDELASWLDEQGEGIHHVCFGVDDVPAAVAEISGGEPPAALGSGRGRPSAFVPGELHGVRLECTRFSREDDVDGTLAG